MPFIDFQATGFANDTLNITPQMDCVPWEDVFKAAITVGHRDETALLQYGVLSWFESLTRFYRIRMTLKQDHVDALQPTDLFHAMDPSEKAAASYYLGLTFCKLYALRHLDCPWLMHHDVYRAYLASPLAKGMRPDLVGLSANGQWMVFEAKGCRRRPSPKSRTRAKDQAKSLSSVQGQPIALRVVSWTRITRSSVVVTFEDPPNPSPGSSAQGLNLKPEVMLEHYYRPLLALHDLTHANQAALPPQTRRYINEIGLHVEIQGELLTLLREELYSKAYQHLLRWTKSPGARDFGLDGVSVRAAHPQNL